MDGQCNTLDRTAVNCQTISMTAKAPHADVTSLFDGHLRDLVSTVALLKRHFANHADEFDDDLRSLWQVFIDRIDTDVTSMRCDWPDCQKAATTPVDTDAYCTAHSAMFVECMQCHRHFDPADTHTIEGDEHYCRGCIPVRGDYV
jgi:hypothetical protein